MKRRGDRAIVRGDAGSGAAVSQVGGALLSLGSLARGFRKPFAAIRIILSSDHYAL